MECKSKKGCEFEERLTNNFPLTKEANKQLFYEVCQYQLIMSDVAERVSVPMEELIEFFYKGKVKMDMIKEQEEVLSKNEQGETYLRQV